MQFMIPVIIFVFGAIYGSFINVIIFRLPKNLSIILPKSFCFHCKTPIPMYRNIPIVSFLIQNGKCANCNCKISIQYPIIELITGFIFLLLKEHFIIIGLPESCQVVKVKKDEKSACVNANCLYN